jgi:hypothetical protein
MAMFLRKSGVQQLFGSKKELWNSAIAVIPLFSPLTYDDFTEGQHSKLLKYQYVSLSTDVGHTDEISNVLETPEGQKARQVPLYSDVLVWDDYLAFAQFQQLFAHQGYGPVALWDDQTVVATADGTQGPNWWHNRLILTFGSPRSNQFLRLLLAMWGARNVAVLKQASTNLDQWHATLRIKAGESFNERHLPDADAPIETTAYGVVFKRVSPHPHHQSNSVLSVVGDCSESTQLGAYVVCHEVDDLAEQVGSQSFLLLLKIDRAAAQKAAQGGRDWASLASQVRRELFVIEEETGYVSPVAAS